MSATRRSTRPSLAERIVLEATIVFSLSDLMSSTRRALADRRVAGAGPRLFLVVDLDALFLAHLLDVDVHRCDDLRLRIGLAIDDDPMLELLGAIDLQFAVPSQAVVPAAVPNGHEVGVFLKGVGELSAGQLLYVQVALRIGVGGQLDLSLRGAGAKQRHCTNRYHQFHFFLSLSKR